MKKMIAVAMIATFAVACNNNASNTPVSTDSTKVDSITVVKDTTKVADTTKNTN